MNKTFTFTLLFILTVPLALADPLGWSVDRYITVPPSYIHNPSIDIDHAGNLHAAYIDYQDGTSQVYYTKLKNDGSPLISNIRVTFNLSEVGNPSLVVDSHNNIHIVWEAEENNERQEIYYIKLNDQGIPLTDIKRVTFDPRSSRYPRIAVDTSENVHLVWLDSRNLNLDVYYKKLDSIGNSLTEDINVSADALSSYDPDIDVDLRNNVHIVWSSANEDYYDVSYKKLDNVGRALTPVIRLAVNASDELDHASIATDYLGNVHVAWYDEGLEDVFYSKLDNNGNLLIYPASITLPGGVSRFPSLVADLNANVHITWSESQNPLGNGVYYTKLDNFGRKIVEDLHLTALQGREAPFVTDKNENVHIVWESSDSLFYKRSLQLIRVEGQPVVGNSINISLIDTSHPALDYAMAMSFNFTNGIPVGDGRVIPLDQDPLFNLTFYHPALIGLHNSVGQLGTNGIGHVTLQIPDIPELRGRTISMAFVTTDSRFSIPIVAVSDRFTMTFI